MIEVKAINNKGSMKDLMRLKNATRLAVALTVLLVAAGCDKDSLRTNAEIERYVKHDLREWRETREGVRYFTTCAEGYLLIATPSSHSGVQLAGPIGKCN